MRRALSIFLILVFGVGPLSSTLGASEDTRLPACCRRHGAHHCAVSAGMTAMMAGGASGKIIVTAPSTCPAYPGSADETTPAPFGLPVPLTQMRSPDARRAPSATSLEHFS
jgi:hypothetical protein